ncbi:hypothetical protein [Aquipuribacter sp. MA13-6]|uniref:hypothetical protein n=1 Tax=unclassified Aquipuribacter TaxID=2635084 RepID=UPI003EEC0DF7
MHPDRRAAAGPLRAAVAASAVVGLAGAGHLLAGGGTPSFRALVLALLVVTLLSTAVASRQVSAWRLTAVVAGGQVVLHHAFAWVPGGHGAAALDPASEAAHQGLWSDPTMLTAHVLATAVTVVLLRRGETALVALCSWAGPLLLVVVSPAPVGSARPLLAGAEPMPLGAPAAAADPVRGPPQSFALAA